MLIRSLYKTSKCVLNKQISSVVNTQLKLKQVYINSCFNAHFCNGKAVSKYFIYPGFCSNNSKTISKKPLTVKESKNLLNRYYSGDPSVTFLSGGKSNYFEDNALYGDDKLLNDIIKQLKEDNGVDICVIETSEERRKYADYVIVVSGRSTRHLKAMTNHIHQQCKKDFPEKHAIVTGLDSDDWMIVDFGFIVAHLFLPEIREKYELEKLWSLGPEQDEQYQQMLEDDRYAEMVKNAKLEDFFVKEDSSQ